MTKITKDELLNRLKNAQTGEIPARIDLPPPFENALSKEELIEKFTNKLIEQEGVVYRTNNQTGTLEKLAQILAQEGVKKAMAAEDDVVKPLDLPAWGKHQGIKITTQFDYKNRESFKESIFNQVDAGITGADFAIAESGTLALVHDKYQARLISLAPILHIAVVPVERVVPVYESVTEKVYQGDNTPSQLTLITGPSMTADIQGIMFKGMHGPRRLIVILMD